MSSFAVSYALGVSSTSTRRRSVGSGTGQAGPFQAVDHRGDGAGGEPALYRQIARAHAPVLVEDVQAPRVGAIDPHDLGEELIDDVGRPLVGSDLVAELRVQLQALRRRFS